MTRSAGRMPVPYPWLHGGYSTWARPAPSSQSAPAVRFMRLVCSRDLPRRTYTHPRSTQLPQYPRVYCPLHMTTQVPGCRGGAGRFAQTLCQCMGAPPRSRGGPRVLVSCPTRQTRLVAPLGRVRGKPNGRWPQRRWPQGRSRGSEPAHAPRAPPTGSVA